MTNKETLQTLIIKIQELESAITEIKKEMVLVIACLPDKEIEDDVEFFVKLKYDEIKYNDPETWIHIQTLPKPILIQWDQRLWLDKKSRPYNSSAELKMKEELTEKGYKSVEHWLWYIPDFIKSILCDQTSISENLRRITEQYNKGSVASKKYMKVYFDMLDEEIKSFENRIKK